MRKRIIEPSTPGTTSSDEQWLDLERLAQVEVTSEDPVHPIESALIPGIGPGWRAAQSGKQTVRILFEESQTVRHIRLVFDEGEGERTQEFVLRWSPDGQAYQEIARQQYNFSPASTPRELEDYTVELNGLTVLELTIVPDISRGPACASVAQLRLA